MAAKALNIDDLGRLARKRLPAVIWDFLDGGAEDETTLAGNRLAFKTWTLKPRVLSGNGRRDLSIEMFGRRLSSPLIVAPTGLSSIFWRNGDRLLAAAARDAGIGFSLSTASNASMEDIAGLSDGVRLFQLYPWADMAFRTHLVERAAAAGYDALILTVDSIVAGNRERDNRNRFAHSVRMSPRVIFDALKHPVWLTSTWLPTGMPRFENVAGYLPAGATAADLVRFVQTQRSEWFGWDDAARIRAQWKGPLIIKGILHEDDMRRARSLGADGVVVSNHGGRALDGAVATLDALVDLLPHAKGMLVMLDGGIRRGTDVVKALALGAHCVLTGRATLYGLAAGGGAGAARAIEILRSEIDRAVGQMGCACVQDINASLIRRATG